MLVVQINFLTEYKVGRENMKFNQLAALFLIGIFLIGSNAYAGDLLNKYLPSKLRADLQVRYRIEYKDDFDLKDGSVDKDVYSMQEPDRSSN